MKKMDVNAALKILTNNMNNGILTLNDDTLALLDQKHHDAKEAPWIEVNRSTVKKN